MGEKIEPVFSSGFELVEPGVHVFELADPKATKEKGGYHYEVKCICQGGGSDGIFHFEHFYTRKKDESVNTFGLKLLYGFLVSVGVMKAGGMDTDEFESPGFVKKFEGGLTGKMVGLNIYHDKYEGKEKSKSNESMTVEEAKKRMSKPAKEASKPAASATKDTEGW